MTSAHILYIPLIFSLGFLAGTLLRTGSVASYKTNGGGQTPQLVSGRALLGSFVIIIIVFIGTHFIEIPRSSKAVGIALHGAEIFDKKPSYSSAEVYKRIAAFPEEGLRLYQQFTYTIDILFPATLFVFLFLLSSFVNRRFFIRKEFQTFLFLLPILWFGSDMIENAVIYSLLNRFPVRMEFFASILGYITFTKFTLLLLSIAGPILAIVVPTKPGEVTAE